MALFVTVEKWTLTLAHLDWTFSPAPFQTPLLLDPDETRNALQMELSNYATWNAVYACINWGFEWRHFNESLQKWHDDMLSLASRDGFQHSVELNFPDFQRLHNGEGQPVQAFETTRGIPFKFSNVHRVFIAKIDVSFLLQNMQTNQISGRDQAIKC